MTRILLYWNHICVLHNREKEFLDRLTARLKPEGIDLTVRYFGLGYPYHLSEYLARPDAILPDLIVSADLEVFEHRDIYGKLKERLHKTAAWVPLRSCAARQAVCQDPHLLPFVAIPLVYYTSDPASCQDRQLTQVESLAFGGINNSAGKTIAKTVWSHYGAQAARELLQRSHVSDMPIGAFQQVRTGQCRTALVPSIYALRADQQRTFLQTPQEGALLIPSYFCALHTVEESLARRLANEIMAPELSEFYASSGDLIVFPACTDRRSRQESGSYFCPLKTWYEQTDARVFEDLYTEALPRAQRLVI